MKTLENYLINKIGSSQFNIIKDVVMSNKEKVKELLSSMMPKITKELNSGNHKELNELLKANGTFGGNDDVNNPLTWILIAIVIGSLTVKFFLDMFIPATTATPAASAEPITINGQKFARYEITSDGNCIYACILVGINRFKNRPDNWEYGDLEGSKTREIALRHLRNICMGERHSFIEWMLKLMRTDFLLSEVQNDSNEFKDKYIARYPISLEKLRKGISNSRNFSKDIVNIESWKYFMEHPELGAVSYGGHFVVQYFVDTYKPLRVVIYSKNSVSLDTDDNKIIGSENTVYLYYINNTHYQLLLPYVNDAPQPNTNLATRVSNTWGGLSDNLNHMPKNEHNHSIKSMKTLENYLINKIGSSQVNIIKDVVMSNKEKVKELLSSMMPKITKELNSGNHKELNELLKANGTFGGNDDFDKILMWVLAAVVLCVITTAALIKMFSGSKPNNPFLIIVDNQKFARYKIEIENDCLYSSILIGEQHLSDSSTINSLDKLREKCRLLRKKYIDWYWVKHGTFVNGLDPKIDISNDVQNYKKEYETRYPKSLDILSYPNHPSPSTPDNVNINSWEYFNQTPGLGPISCKQNSVADFFTTAFNANFTVRIKIIDNTSKVVYDTGDNSDEVVSYKKKPQRTIYIYFVDGKYELLLPYMNDLPQMDLLLATRVHDNKESMGGSAKNIENIENILRADQIDDIVYNYNNNTGVIQCALTELIPEVMRALNGASPSIKKKINDIFIKYMTGGMTALDNDSDTEEDEERIIAEVKEHGKKWSLYMVLGFFTVAIMLGVYVSYWVKKIKDRNVR